MATFLSKLLASVESITIEKVEEVVAQQLDLKDCSSSSSLKGVASGLLFYFLTVYQSEKFKNLDREAQLTYAGKYFEKVVKIVSEKEILYPIAVRFITGILTFLKPTNKEFARFINSFNALTVGDVNKIKHVGQIEVSLFLEKEFKELWKKNFSKWKSTPLVSKNTVESFLNHFVNYASQDLNVDSSIVWNLFAHSVVSQGGDVFQSFWEEFSKLFEDDHKGKKRVCILIMKSVFSFIYNLDEGIIKLVLDRPFLEVLRNNLFSKSNTIAIAKEISGGIINLAKHNSEKFALLIIKSLYNCGQLGGGITKIIDICIRGCVKPETRGEIIKFFTEEAKQAKSAHHKMKCLKWISKSASNVKVTSKNDIQSVLEQLFSEALFVKQEERQPQKKEDEKDELEKEKPKQESDSERILNKALILLDTLMKAKVDVNEKNEIWQYSLVEFIRKKEKKSPIVLEVLEHTKESQKELHSLLKKLSKHTNEQATAFKTLLAHLYLITFQDNSEEFSQEIKEVCQCTSDYLKDNKSLETNISVIIDILIGLLTRNSCRGVVKVFFGINAQFVTDEAFSLLLNVVNPVNDDIEEDEELLEGEGEGIIAEDNEEEQNQDESKEDNEESNQGDNEMDDEEDNVIQIPEGVSFDFNEDDDVKVTSRMSKNHMSLEKLLRASKIAQEDIEGDYDIPLEQAKPEDLQRIDNALASYFQEKTLAKSPKKKTGLELQIITHKLRALDLLYFYFSKNPENPHVLTSIPYLVHYLLRYSVASSQVPLLDELEDVNEDELDIDEIDMDEEAKGIDVKQLAKVLGGQLKEDEANEEEHDHPHSHSHDEEDVDGEEEEVGDDNEPSYINAEISKSITKILHKVILTNKKPPAQWDKASVAEVFGKLLEMLKVVNTKEHQVFLQKHFLDLLFYLARGLDSQQFTTFCTSSSSVFSSVVTSELAEMILQRVLKNFPLFGASVLGGLVELIKNPKERFDLCIGYFHIIEIVIYHSKTSNSLPEEFMPHFCKPVLDCFIAMLNRKEVNVNKKKFKLFDEFLGYVKKFTEVFNPEKMKKVWNFNENIKPFISDYTKYFDNSKAFVKRFKTWCEMYGEKFIQKRKEADSNDQEQQEEEQNNSNKRQKVDKSAQQQQAPKQQNTATSPSETKNKKSKKNKNKKQKK